MMAPEASLVLLILVVLQHITVKLRRHARETNLPVSFYTATIYSPGILAVSDGLTCSNFLTDVNKTANKQQHNYLIIRI